MGKLDRDHSHRIGLAKVPKKFGGHAIGNMMGEAWRIQGVRDLLDSSDKTKKRHEFKSAHCFRKIFETKCQNARMNHNHIKLLMDHSLGESQNYHRPIEQELLEDYLNAVDSLTISEENKLKVKVELLENDRVNYEKLDAKIDALQRQWLKTRITVGPPNSNEDEQRPITHEEIEHILERRRKFDNARRRRDKKILSEL